MTYSLFKTITLLCLFLFFKDLQGLAQNYKVIEYKHVEQSIPSFFDNLTKNHIKDYWRLDSSSFLLFCSTNGIRNNDSLNIKKYYQLMILHELFSSQSADNGSMGKILHIPYLWHWVKPNPRHSIRLIETEELLRNKKPSTEFKKYTSQADIDRTPFLFISDLLAEEPKYKHPDCGTFSTFGWCSEREMAFVCLTSLLNYKGKVISKGNHSWSQLIVEMENNDGSMDTFKVSIDNTFDRTKWKKIDHFDNITWSKKLGDSSTPRWYNAKARSTVEKQKIRNYKVSTISMKNIENQLVNYLNKQIH